jgi:TIR domain
VSGMAASVPTLPRGIFISYRRQETAYAAGWLYQQLRDRFGSEQIFKDVDNLDPGDDFYEKIDDAVGSCAVLLALIGDQWLDVVDHEGTRRLDDPQDFVRLEIEAALRRGVRVVPLLVAGARMPRPESLPSSLSGITRRQAVELSPERFEADTQRLLGVIERTLAEAQALHDAGAATRPDPVHVATAEQLPSTESESAPAAPISLGFGTPQGVGDDRAVTGPIARPESSHTTDTPPASSPAFPPGARARRDTPSGIPLWVPPALVVVALLLVWVNWPGQAESLYAWKDHNLSGLYAYRAWNDDLFWGPVILLIGAVGAAFSRLLVGLALGAAAYTAGTATTILAGGLAADQTGAWPA